MNELTDHQILTYLLFSETKDPEDAHKIANVVMNRLKRSGRFGQTLRDVVFAPDQFTGVGTKEWNKAVNKQFTVDKESSAYKHATKIAGLALRGELEDKTGGADHYYNPLEASPSWGKKTTPDKVGPREYYYKSTVSNEHHSYFKETLRGAESTKKAVKSEALKEVPQVDEGVFSDAFSSARKAGKKEFTWKGNRYNTKTAGE